MTRGERIIQRRQELSWTRTELSKRSGVGYDRLNKLEHDRTKEPRGNTIRAIAKTLGVPEHYLETGEDKELTLDEHELRNPIQSRHEAGGGQTVKHAWEAAEAIEFRVYGKQGGGIEFLLGTYERILMRMKIEKDEKK